MIKFAPSRGWYMNESVIKSVVKRGYKQKIDQSMRPWTMYRALAWDLMGPGSTRSIHAMHSGVARAQSSIARVIYY